MRALRQTIRDLENKLLEAEDTCEQLRMNLGTFQRESSGGENHEPPERPLTRRQMHAEELMALRKKYDEDQKALEKELEECRSEVAHVLH